ncbi:hypothetical protein P7228_13405 [Altererythrobacter arenosus]|uniref:Uncharacterized protein n=1 Tax=Altererythrobacter arenosus TaxID=3032592 RepID=A0ABY8FPP0_9SPHN|nr:hypothetical protein [Altererythrobacter sp. CAU 1644]WFL76977.1 hypothetical protein P7228_13405 [Altererythrobacter sp. CAU 1644]
MSVDLAAVQGWGVIFLLVLVFVAMPLGVVLSLRRNARDIESFEHPDLNELKLCVPNHQTERLSRKLDKMGWQLVSETADEKIRSNSHVRFEKSGDEARPLKEVLHSLNKSLALSIGPLNLRREEVDQ